MMFEDVETGCFNPMSNDHYRGYQAGAQSRQDEVDDLKELHRLYKIALSHCVNSVSIHVHKKIADLETKIKGETK